VSGSIITRFRARNIDDRVFSLHCVAIDSQRRAMKKVTITGRKIRPAVRKSHNFRANWLANRSQKSINDDDDDDKVPVARRPSIPDARSVGVSRPELLIFRLRRRLITLYRLWRPIASVKTTTRTPCGNSTTLRGASARKKACRQNKTSDRRPTKTTSRSRSFCSSPRLRNLPISAIIRRDYQSSRRPSGGRTFVRSANECFVIFFFQCVICVNARATMQTAPCGHRVVCR